ncbi:Transcriptional regulator [Pseudonocardia sp. Ae168_Ps1]|uniref:winged helix-turn-helix domain-containing protein n=1 Tax=unclassified Pseudonocardia TaxID=2619320 RepID=UPI00094B09DB|nr:MULTISPECIES: transcriptional regulator [unclassified Pseudonocardia]OLL73656.1 Transcriptional regulator [Pseudonocardia sp. Ae150A_Ps1]OLL79632.1 Transcriptional regulator [Pseudonocardia sp. Ae168_Ps1]OLL86230.1 Transcriptional regulator [Pseudonocardia sp. Ae263_Ps1]OLL93739.1 Transcriptional regulator [Pseudonocardia sp. Ae356_Ps1]
MTGDDVEQDPTPDPGDRAGREPIFETGPRLALCALLQGAEWVDFATARDMLGASDSAVSKHSRTLEEAGYLEVRKGSVGRRPRTWFRLTPDGQDAIRRHLDWLAGLRSALDTP